MTEPRSRMMLLSVAAALLLGSVILFGSHRCSSGSRRDEVRVRAPVRPAEAAGAEVTIECRVFEIPPASAADAEVAALVDPVSRAGPSSIDRESADAMAASIDALVAAGKAAVLSAPRVTVRTSEPATLTLADTPGPAGGTRFELSVEYRPVAREDGTIDLGAAFMAKRVDAGIETVLEGMGLPVGDRASGRGALTVPEGGAAVWTRNLGDSLIVIVARPTVGG